MHDKNTHENQDENARKTEFAKKMFKKEEERNAFSNLTARTPLESARELKASMRLVTF